MAEKPKTKESFRVRHLTIDRNLHVIHDFEFLSKMKEQVDKNGVHYIVKGKGVDHKTEELAIRTVDTYVKTRTGGVEGYSVIHSDCKRQTLVIHPSGLLTDILLVDKYEFFR